MLQERIRASLARSPFHFHPGTHPPNEGEADLLVMPAALLDSVSTALPVIAWGPAGLMRSAFLHGCADYLREPWSPEELALRAEAVLARQQTRLQFPWGTVRWEGDTLRTPHGFAAFTRHEAIILRALLRCRGQPVSRAALAALLGAGRARDSRRVDVHVSAIRRRVRSAEPRAGRFVVCVRRQGYLIE